MSNKHRKLFSGTGKYSLGKHFPQSSCFQQTNGALIRHYSKVAIKLTTKTPANTVLILIYIIFTNITHAHLPICVAAAILFCFCWS